jgi:hypothetical protein
MNSNAPLFIKNTHENAASPNLAAGQQKLVGPTKQNHFFCFTKR